MLTSIAQLIGYTTAVILLVVAVMAATGLMYSRKNVSPFVFYKIKSNIGMPVIKNLSSAVSSTRIKGWNKLHHGRPYILLELMVTGGQKNLYFAIPRGFESEFEKFGLLNNMHVEKAHGIPYVRAQNFHVSNFSFAGIGSLSKLDKLIEPAVNSSGGAVIQLALRSQGYSGVLKSNARLITFGDEVESKRLMYSLSHKNSRVLAASDNLRYDASSRSFNEKESENLYNV